jgi:hypothetical protein
MRERSEVLFSDYDLRATLEAHEQKMNAEIDGLDRGRALETGLDALCDQFEKEYRVEVPRLDETRIKVTQEDAQVDVSHDPMRAIFDRSQPFYVSGTQISFLVPFSGDKGLFKCRPSSFNFNPPRAVVGENQLSLVYTVIEPNPEALRGGFDRDIAQIRQWLTSLDNDAAQFNASLRTKARQRLERRREKLTRDQNLVAGLGFPVQEDEG